MLRGYYAPTDFESQDADLTLSLDEKLALIASSPATVTHLPICGNYTDTRFLLSLPFGTAITFNLMDIADRTNLYTEYVCVGDEQLRREGLGSRLLGAASRFAVERDQRVSTLTTNAARLGLINAAVNVFGVENVAVIDFGDRWGWMGDKPLEAMFDDRPFVPGEKYIPGTIEARIDPGAITAWEMPVYQPPEV